MSYYSTPQHIREENYIAVHGDPRIKPPTRKRGLGDLVEFVARKTGVKAFVDRRSARTGKPCGCQQRKELLNNMTDKVLRRR